ncbi:MAG: hypothetical protein Q4C96_02280 [Planctomycetia bacterium]|nr:hypothetical protein [Planctomycetia bacterium]
MDKTTSISAIHRSEHQGVFAFTGGGSVFLSRLLCTPGASHTVLEAIIPYSYNSLQAFLNFSPEQACCELTARKMAVTAWQRAIKYTGSPSAELFGFSCTASLKTEKMKRGQHHAFMAFHSLQKTCSLSITLLKDHRSRHEEEQLLASLAQYFFHHSLRADTSSFGEHSCFRTWREQLKLHSSESLFMNVFCPPKSWQELFAGNRAFVCLRLPENKEVSPPEENFALFPGSFAPFHEGHAQMRKLAMSVLHQNVALEMAIINADKPSLDYLDIHQRLNFIIKKLHDENDHTMIFLTNLPFFNQKVTVFPHTTFVVGSDTLIRITDPRYHDNNKTLHQEFLRYLLQQKCRFLVLGRTISGKFVSLSDLDLPETLKNICLEIPESQFRNDISSTWLRNQEKNLYSEK